MDKRKFSYVRIRGKRILVIGDIVKIPRVFIHPDTPKKVVWMEPS